MFTRHVPIIEGRSKFASMNGGYLCDIAIYSTAPIAMEQDLFFNVHGATGGYASAGYGM